MRSCFSSPPSCSRISSAAGAPFRTSSASASSVRTAQGIMPSMACSSPRAFSMRSPISCSSFALSSLRLPTCFRYTRTRSRSSRDVPGGGAASSSSSSLLASLRSGSSPSSAMDLIFERFGVVFLDELTRGQHHGLVGVIGWNDPELVRALTPVEDMGVAIRLGPVDQRIGVGTGAPPPRAWFRCRRPLGCGWSGSHNSRVLQVGCPVYVICSRPIGGRQLLP